jgi:hypothetical protein
MVLKITKALLKTARKAARRMLGNESSVSSPGSEFGVLVTNSAGQSLHVERPNGSKERVGYLEFWVRNSSRTHFDGHEVKFVYRDQILAPTSRMRDCNIPDGGTVHVIIQ